MPRKIRDLIRDLRKAGFVIVPGGGKGGHRKMTHETHDGLTAIIAGHDGDDARHYLEKQIASLIRQAEEEDRKTEG
jgi:predicted RNA binding protein YcfA (HicA-like mRNA interferase family)